MTSETGPRPELLYPQTEVGSELYSQLRAGTSSEVAALSAHRRGAGRTERASVVAPYNSLPTSEINLGDEMRATFRGFRSDIEGIWAGVKSLARLVKASIRSKPTP